MALSLDAIILAVSQVDAAHSFYARASSSAEAPASTTSQRIVTLRGHGSIELHDAAALAAVLETTPVDDTQRDGFRGFALSVIVRGPQEVTAMLDFATGAGAHVVRTPKKRIFGEFTAVYRAPDGTLCKIAAASKKDAGPITTPPELRETALYLAARSAKASTPFYTALGMTTEHDYGDTFTDFAVGPGSSRLGLLPGKGLARDLGVEASDAAGADFSGVVLAHTAPDRAAVDDLLERAQTAGGRLVTAPAFIGTTYAGHVADPDGHVWQIRVNEG